MRLSSRKTSFIVPASIGALALIGAVIGVNVGITSAHPSVDVVASNWKFTPAKIEAHVGEATTLILTSSEGVHGIESAELGIPKTMILPEKLTDIKFTPQKAGTYELHCTIVCGAGHEKMLLTVQVVP
ncbi:MAG: hypothetical protein NVSMB64_24070 [Candidatus Velthaea sp.]